MFEKLFGKKNTNKRVLVIEDDSMLAKVLAESLKIEKFEVVIVADGTKVMEAVAKFLPGIILLDLIIPGIDGFAVLKQLKEDPKTKNIPVAVVSNLNQVSDVKAVKALGAAEYFLKATTNLDIIVDYVKKTLK